METWADSQKQKGQDKMCSQRVDGQMPPTVRTPAPREHPLLPRRTLVFVTRS